MNTKHLILNLNSNNTSKSIQDSSVHLVVTSPPYPMIKMWDKSFSEQDKKIGDYLATKKFYKAFECMNLILDKTWEDINRILVPGGIVCINIGDATRNCNKQFKLFSNHSRIIQKFLSMGFDVLPDIHWHKPTNSTNKFMGSGMYPTCAYVTYEHEYILIFRKGTNRKFNSDQKQIRKHSAYFWEERNMWFSDLWELKGTNQKMVNVKSRDRSAAFPFELAYRLINMYSIKGDYVYDPFVGTGTVIKAAIASERNSIGAEIDKELCTQINNDLCSCKEKLNKYIVNRLDKHIQYIKSLSQKKKSKLYTNIKHNFSVKTRQETEILISLINSIKKKNDIVYSTYKKNNE